MTRSLDLDLRYIVARRVLLDALVALEDHKGAVILVGAQAVYLRTQLTEVADLIAPFTTDGDLALDPTALIAEPELESAMEGAGFHLFRTPSGGVEPGIWISDAVIDGKNVGVPVDLIVPEAASDGQGRRGARLGLHGDRAARRAVGLEAALVDNGPVRVAALDPADQRSVVAKVAGVAALLVAKSHKIHDRAVSGRVDRLLDKDAADVFRMMQASRPESVATTMHMLAEHDFCGTVTRAALEFMRDLFGRRDGAGLRMAQSALQNVIDPDTAETVSIAYVTELLNGTS